MPHADLLITNARVFTATPGASSYSADAQAVAVVGNRIAFVGSAADAQGWRGANTRVIDGQDCTLTPGIIDSHYHLAIGSTELGHIQLGAANNLAEVSALVRQYAAAHPDEDSLSGVGMRYEIMPPGTMATRNDLDAIVSDRPFTILAYDHHTAFANTRALEVAGVLHGARTGPNSEIQMGDDGLANGVLVEPAAYCVVLSHFEAWARTVKGLMGETAGKPRINAARDRRWLDEGLKLTASYGITSVHNMDGDYEQASVYAALAAEGALPVRVNIPFSVFPSTHEDELEQASQMARDFNSPLLSSGRTKFFMDGVIESWTALLLDDYADRAGWLGDALYSAEHFNRMALACDQRGLQITVHAIGDGAVRRTLDGYALCRQQNGARDSRHRIEHIELVHPADLPRFAQLGVVASMQPVHAPLAYPETNEVGPVRVGMARAWRSCAWQLVRGAGARLAFGSDWPVVTQDVMLGVHTALNRRPWSADLPDQRQSLHDTLVSYTHDGAYAEFREHDKGQVRDGYLADLTLWDHDLFAMPVGEIESARAALTICDGRVTYEA
jgi:predicted amidohydrolase YtcJ